MRNRSILVALSLKEIELILAAFYFVSHISAPGEEEKELCEYLNLQLESFREEG